MRADAKLRRLLFTSAVLHLLSGAALAAPWGGGSAPLPTALDRAWRAAYPQSAPAAATQLCGVDLSQLTLPGLHLTSRSEREAEAGGIVLSYSDGAEVVRVVLAIAVTPDSAAARRVLDAALHAVATPLSAASDATLGDLVWADDLGKGAALLLATQANVAYSVRVADGALAVPSAAAIAGVVRKAMRSGPPTFPAARLTLPTTVEATAGGEIGLTIPSGASYQLRADGGYIARGLRRPVIRPFGPGAVTVYATVSDELGRVTVLSQTTVAK